MCGFLEVAGASLSPCTPSLCESWVDYSASPTPICSPRGKYLRGGGKVKWFCAPGRIHSKPICNGIASVGEGELLSWLKGFFLPDGCFSSPAEELDWVEGEGGGRTRRGRGGEGGGKGKPSSFLSSALMALVVPVLWRSRALLYLLCRPQCRPSETRARLRKARMAVCLLLFLFTSPQQLSIRNSKQMLVS